MSTEDHPAAAARPAGMKLYTQRTGRPDRLADLAALQRTVNRLRASPLAPPGVHRFTSHEEAQRWMDRQMARLHGRRRSTTSPRSAAGSTKPEPATS